MHHHPPSGNPAELLSLPGECGGSVSLSATSPSIIDDPFPTTAPAHPAASPSPPSATHVHTHTHTHAHTWSTACPVTYCACVDLWLLWRVITPRSLRHDATLYHAAPPTDHAPSLYSGANSLLVRASTTTTARTPATTLLSSPPAPPTLETAVDRTSGCSRLPGLRRPSLPACTPANYRTPSILAYSYSCLCQHPSVDRKPPP